MNAEKEITDLIARLSLDNVLTEAAAERLNTVLRDNADMKAELDAREEETKELLEDRLRLTVRVKELETEAADVTLRERKVEDREEEMVRAEERLKAAEARVEDHRRMVELVFRNIEVRRNVFTAVPGIPASENPYQPATLPFVEQNQQVETSE